MECPSQTMDWSIILTSSVVGAAVAGLVNLVALFVQNSLIRKRVRQKKIWQQKQEDVRDLEYHAGHLTEYLTGYQRIDADSENLWESLQEVRKLKYRMRKYPEILQSIRDFESVAGFRLREKKTFSSREEREEAVDELKGRYDDLIQACKEELAKDEI